jgi:hypothetical protein
LVSRIARPLRDSLFFKYSSKLKDIKSPKNTISPNSF